MFYVLDKPCNQCLYGKNKIVSDDRKKQLLKGLENRDDYFICHKATIKNKVVACRGDWNARGCGKTGRIAQVLGLVVFVAEKAIGSVSKLRKEQLALLKKGKEK